MNTAPKKVAELRSAEECVKRAETRRVIAARLVDARCRAGFKTASDAARVLGIAGSTYLAHENGTRTPGIDMLRRYARRFGVSENWLMTGEGGMDGPSEPALPNPELRGILVELNQHCVNAALKLDQGDAVQMFSHLVGLIQILKKAE